jgi:hypothetical protein
VGKAPANRDSNRQNDCRSTREPSRNGAERIRELEVESSLVQGGPINLPPVDQRTPGWWKSLSTGSGERRITVEATEFVLRTIVTQVHGPRRGVKIDIGDQDPTLAELWSAITDTCDAAGWQALARRGES